MSESATEIDNPIQIVPPWSADAAAGTSYTIHQIAPYIGRMKASMARHLIDRWTTTGESVVDPFCGCGTVAVEAAAQGRLVFAGDWNPYAVLLTRAKIFPPDSLADAERRLAIIWRKSRAHLKTQDLRRVPPWVRRFFHPATLKSALAFRDACAHERDEFLLSCLLGILHHQRPGFLSFPSSHLVPYLRNNKFPRDRHPDLYEPRDVYSRMLSKIRRTYKRVPLPYPARREAQLTDARRFPYVGKIDAVVTSPPYMNELDYVRDNRLRLWFIGRCLPQEIELTARDRIQSFHRLMKTVCIRLSPWISCGGRFVIVVGDATRGGGNPGLTADVTRELFSSVSPLRTFRLDAIYEDAIPDVRRSRRECRGTRKETVLVYEKRPG